MLNQAGKDVLLQVKIEVEIQMKTQIQVFRYSSQKSIGKKTQQGNLPTTKLLKQAAGKDASFVAAHLAAHKIGRSPE